MYNVEARWAGYVLSHVSVSTIAEYQEIIQTLKETFLAGMIANVQGSQHEVKVLCVDVFYAGNIIEQVDFKT